jgi:hypothetical protein
MLFQDAARAGRAKENEIFLAALLEPLREMAKKHGYAVAVHGSLARDIDLVAIPWTAEAVSAPELVAALYEVIVEKNDGVGWFQKGEPPSYYLAGEEKPHGRRAWSIYLGRDEHGPYLDISVMPRLAKI